MKSRSQGSRGSQKPRKSIFGGTGWAIASPARTRRLGRWSCWLLASWTSCFLLPLLLALFLIAPLAAGQKSESKDEPRAEDEAAPRDAEQKEAPPISKPENPQLETLRDRKKARQEMDVGKFHMRRRNYPAAAARFEEAIKWDPDFAEPHRRLGEAHEKTGELQKAVENLQKFLELVPDSKDARKIRKKICELKKELEE